MTSDITFVQMFGPHDQGNCILVTVNSGLWPVRGFLISFVVIYYSILLLFRKGTFQLMSFVQNRRHADPERRGSKYGRATLVAS